MKYVYSKGEDYSIVSGSKDWLYCHKYDYFCGKCNKEVAEKQNYCPNCGQKLNFKKIVPQGEFRFVNNEMEPFPREYISEFCKDIPNVYMISHVDNDYYTNAIRAIIDHHETESEAYRDLYTIPEYFKSEKWHKAIDAMEKYIKERA